MTHIHITCGSSGCRHERFTHTTKRPPRHSSTQSERNHVSPRGSIGLGRIGSVIRRRGPISSVDRVRIREVLVHRHGLTWGGDDCCQLDVEWSEEGEGTRSERIHFSVIVDITQSRLID